MPDLIKVQVIFTVLQDDMNILPVVHLECTSQNQGQERERGRTEQRKVSSTIHERTGNVCMLGDLKNGLNYAFKSKVEERTTTTMTNL